MAADVYEITKEILSLPEKNGWHKEVNMVSWYGKEPRLDIRQWQEDRSKKGKGITLTKEEALMIIENIEKIKEAVEHAD